MEEARIVDLGNFELFNKIRAGSRQSNKEIRNHEALGVSPETRGIHILWMFPDVLSMHGGRGDAMALLHFSNLMKLPCTIRRINTLTEEIPFDWADMMLFPSGDLSVMEDVCKAIMPKKAEFKRFAESGKVILAIGNTGVLLAEKLIFLDGKVVRGLGLIGAQFKQRSKVFGDDLWVKLPDGNELLGTQIQMADVRLRKGQEPFAKTVYGRGNGGKGREGARTGNVIFTHLLGPVLTKNPWFAEYLLKLSAKSARINSDRLSIPEEKIELELQALEDCKTFVNKKIAGEIH